MQWTHYVICDMPFAFLSDRSPCKTFHVKMSQSRSQSYVPLWPAVGKRELWEQPFWNNKGNNQILGIRFHCALLNLHVCACLIWLLSELSFSDRWSRGKKLWERDWKWVWSARKWTWNRFLYEELRKTTVYGTTGKTQLRLTSPISVGPSFMQD